MTNPDEAPTRSFTPDAEDTLAPLPAGAPPWPAVTGYEVLAELGRGGMGVVYMARQLTLDRVVALKMIRDGELAGPEDRARFRSEALAVARLQHPNVVQVHQVGDHGGRPFLVLELIDGGSLADRLRQGPLAPARAAELVEQIARAVQTAHDAGVIHRDLKPANVLLTKAGAPKITDFGLARQLDAEAARQTQTGAVMGTPSYMAPEQAEGKMDVGPPADVYGLGAILYECLTGRPPFHAATPLDTLIQVVSDPPLPVRRSRREVPRDLDVITLKCLEKAPERRYDSAGALADDLGRWGRGEPIRARPPGLLRRLVPRARWRSLALALLALVLTGISARVWWTWQSWREGKFHGAVARAEKLRDAGRLAESVEAFDEALRLDPRHAGSYSRRAWVHHLLGDNARAEADWAEALRLDPRHSPAYHFRGYHWIGRGRQADALADLSQAIELAPRLARSWYYRAWVYFHLREWDKALADLNEAIRRDEGSTRPDPESYQLRSALHAIGERWALARADFDTAARLGNLGPSTFATRQFAEAACALGLEDEARYRRARDRMLANAEATDSHLDEVLAARACTLAPKGEVPLSRLGPLLERGLKGRPGDAFYLRVQAAVWLRTGRAEEALRQLRLGLSSAPGYSPGLNHLLQALALKALRRELGARNELKLAIDAGAPTSHPHEAMEYQLLLREARQALGQPQP